jgi:flagellar biosynthesis protein FlhG
VKTPPDLVEPPGAPIPAQDPSDGASKRSGEAVGSRRGPRRVVAIGGGKGGCGKSLVTAALGVALARRGRRVVLVDCDLGGANLHSMLGMEYPRGTVSDYILRRVSNLEELIVPTPIAGLGLISGARNAIQAANPMYQQKLRLFRAVQRLGADFVLLDLGAGSHNNVVDFFLLADLGALVVVPEPTSVENAYRFLKAAFLRHLGAVGSAQGVKEEMQQALRERGHAPLTPAELVSAVAARSPEVGEAFVQALASFRPLLLVNQVRDAADLTLGEGIAAAARRLFGLELVLLGCLRYTEQVWRTVRAHRPVSFEQLGGAFTAELDVATERLLERAEAMGAKR